MRTGHFAEGRYFKTKSTAEPFNDNSEAIRRYDATTGSQKLLDAILRAQGITPPHRRTIARPRTRQFTAKAVHTPVCCPRCGGPKAPIAGIIEHIQRTVAAYYEIHPNSMISADRRRSVSHPRQLAMLLCAEFTKKSVSEIARRFGGKDHTTVLYAIKIASERILTDVEIALDATVLRERLSA